MHTTAEKTTRHTSTVQRQSGGLFFARKHDAFFGGEKTSSTSASFIQPKLSVSQPDDPQEKEADHMAHKVMTMPDPVAVAPAAEKPEEVQRAVEEKEPVQRAAENKEEVQRVGEQKEEVQRAAEEEVQKMEAPKEEVRRVAQRKEEKDEVQRSAEEEVQRAEKQEEPVQRSAEINIPRKEEQVQRMCSDCKQEKETVHRQEQKEEVQTKSFDTASSDNHQHFSLSRKEQDESDKKVSRKPLTTHRLPVVMRSGRGPPTTSGNTFEQNLDSTKGIGAPMSRDTLGFMESRFQADFSGVRIHTGETAVQMSQSIHAQAFTHGNDIYFNNGKYSPQTSEGQHLLAHELTHTIQQGASYHTTPSPGKSSGGGNAISAKRIFPKRIIQRSASNLAAAVSFAKGEAGKVIANKDGGDGMRTGWPRLMEYFKTTLGAEKIIPDGQAGDSSTVPESSIKKKKDIDGVAVIMPDGKPGVGKRDIMPSWCGIFAFWSLNKAGLPMKKWELGKMTIPPEAASLTPQPGFLAYRNLRSHYGLVEKADGSQVTTINGNTAGEDNLGGEIQVQTHAISNWTAFIDPMKLIDGTVRNPETGVAEKPKTLDELRKELFGVQRKSEENKGISPEDKKVQPKSAEPATQPLHAQAKTEPDKKEELQRAEEKQSEEKNVQRKEFDRKPVETPAAFVQRKIAAASKSAPVIQRGIFSAIGGAISSAVEWVGDKLEEGKKWLLGKVRDLIMKVPGYKALRVALGFDPITGENIARNGKNFIDAALDLMPGGSLLKRKMEELGILEKAEQFVDNTIGRIGTLINGISDTFSTFYNSLSLSDLKNIPGVFSRLEAAFTSFFNHVKDFAVGVAKDFLEFIKQALLIPLATYIKTKTRFWDLLCLIMGKDPLTDEQKPLTGTNILNAFLNLSEWGVEQRKKMMETGTFQKVAAWIDKGISIFSKSYDELKAAFMGLWKYINIESLMEPVATFQKIFDSFWKPIKRVGEYVIETGVMILKIVKDVLFKWISKKAKETKGFYLVTVLISKDPFTGESVPRTTENLIKGFMLLSEGGEEQFNKMKESGAIDRATAKIDAAVATLGFTWAYVKGLFISLWESFKWTDLLVPVLAFVKIIDTFKNPILRLIRFIITVVVALFEVILRMMGFPVDLVFKLIDNVKKAWASIKSNPTGFLLNLLAAIKQGFVQFFDNILTHLWNGLKAWLKQELVDAGVPIPTDYSVMGIIKWLLAVLDITMEKIWKKLEVRVGKEKVDKIRNLIAKAEAIYDKANEAMEFIEDVRQRGMDAIVDKIKEKLTNMWDMVLDAVKSFIMDNIIKKVTAKLLSMLDPTGIMAVINSAIALYKAIQSFIKYITKMLEIVNSFVEGILEICSGNIKNAANFLERSLADGVPIVIGFLANQVGLDLSGRIRDVLGTVREKVDKGLDFLIDKVVGFVEKLVAKVKQAKDKILGWFGLKKPLTTKDGVNHTLYFTGSENNSVLTIATTPMSVVDYIGKIKTDNKLKDSDVATPLATAQKIDTEEKKDASTDADKQKKTDEVNKLMTQLATELSALPLTAATGVNSGAIYGGEYMGFFGSSAVVAFQKAPFDPGSGPNVSHSIFDKINVRRDLNGSYYVKGHLLNDNLGGPGTTWSNLTPINRQANKDHQLEFEDPVKLIVNGTAAKVTNTKSLPTKGTMKGFSVTASYGRSEPAALSQLKDDSIDDYPSGFDPAWDMTEVIDVLEGEKYVPTQLNCSAVITKENETTEKTHSKTIMNDINYGILSSYQFGAKPKVNVILGEKIKDCKTVTEALAILMEIKGIGYARAQRIIDVFKAKKKITNGKSEIGIGVQALNKQNRDKNITWGAVPASWNPS